MQDLQQKFAFVWISCLKNKPYETGCHFGSVKHSHFISLETVAEDFCSALLDDALIGFSIPCTKHSFSTQSPPPAVHFYQWWPPVCVLPPSAPAELTRRHRCWNAHARTHTCTHTPTLWSPPTVTNRWRMPMGAILSTWRNSICSTRTVPRCRSRSAVAAGQASWQLRVTHRHTDPGARRDPRRAQRPRSACSTGPPGGTAPPAFAALLTLRAPSRGRCRPPRSGVCSCGAGCALHEEGRNAQLIRHGKTSTAPTLPPPNPPVGTRRHTYVVFLLWDASARTRPTGWVLLSTHKTKCNLTADGCSPLDGGNRCLPAPDPRLPSHSEGFPPLCQSAVQRKHFTSSVPCCFFKPKLESWERFHIRSPVRVEITLHDCHVWKQTRSEREGIGAGYCCYSYLVVQSTLLRTPGPLAVGRKAALRYLSAHQLLQVLSCSKYLHSRSFPNMVLVGLNCQ